MARPRPITERPSGRAPTVPSDPPDLNGSLAPAGDLECWLRAAFPPGPRGGLDVARIAGVFDCSPSTVRRWVANDAPVDAAPLMRRAILRGRGVILWPPPDPVTLWRGQQAARVAADAARRARSGEEVRNRSGHGDWDKAHHLHLLWWPTAHVFVPHVSGPALGGHRQVVPVLDPDAPERIRVLTILAIRNGASRTSARRWGARTARPIVEDRDIAEIKGVRENQALLVDSHVYRNRYEALVGLYKLLDDNLARRCVTPAALVPQGRTHALRGPLTEPPVLSTGRRLRSAASRR